MKRIIRSNLKQARQIQAHYQILVDQAQRVCRALRKQEQAARRRVQKLERQLREAGR